MKQPRNPWPYGIILTFVLFISGTVSLVVMACSQKVDLVSANYYEEEIKFQGQVDRLNRTRELGTQATVTYDGARHEITLTLPPQEIGRAISGHIQLYRPSAAGSDREIDLHPDQRGVQTVDSTGLSPGLWKVRVAWTVDKQDYFLERKIVIGAKNS